MKKVFKIIGIVVIVIVALVIAYQVYIVISDKVDDNNVKKEQEKLQEERRNAKTLMEYVKTHDYRYIQCDDENNCNTYNMAFTTKDFKCDALDNIKILDNNYLITKDNEIYDISFYDLYSNNQNCKKKDIDIKIKDVKVSFNQWGKYIVFVSSDNKLYNSNLDKIDDSFEFDTIEYNIYREKNNITGIVGQVNTETIEYNGWNNKEKITLLVLKDDNKIYNQVYHNIHNYDTKKNTYTLKEEKLYKSLEEYGNIQEIVTSNYYTSNSGKNYQLEDNTPTTIISDKGYYYLDEVKTDECIKYKDIECKLELKESEIYKRFSKDIKFIGQQYTILSDNSVIETQYLTYPLDKDLKN